MNPVDKMYVKALNQLKNRVISSKTIPLVVFELMKLVESEKLTGLQKKNSVITILNLILDSQTISDSEKQKMKVIIETCLPSMIDAFISIDTNKINISISKCIGCFSL